MHVAESLLKYHFYQSLYTLLHYTPIIHYTLIIHYYSNYTLLLQFYIGGIIIKRKYMR